ncbi:hypothetical protein LVY72_13160 [Arthrobacter sp. I2-34]|uniref:MFS transporter n=1 Tax=Arthrobacter hankyongi TaxID=2904801 RepID=A0ABS9L889_9MICC|nr:hypothetical protein [Arthrobacter hankyongi]MCG2622850.1 hypothetical protein [Arthrobacter hankyongi]
MQTGALWRLLRSAAVASVVLSLSAAAHVAGGGTLPAPGILAALAALTMLPATVLAGRRLGAASLAGLLGGGQWVLHQAFTALGVTASCTPGGAAGTLHAWHTFPGDVAALDCAAASGLDHSGSAAMTAAHILASVLAGLMLLKGEQALWTLLAWLRPLVHLPAAVVLPPAGTRAEAPAALPLPRTLIHHRLDPRRGPPAVA